MFSRSELRLHLRIWDQPAFPEQASATPDLSWLAPTFYSCKGPRSQAKIIQISVSWLQFEHSCRDVTRELQWHLSPSPGSPLQEKKSLGTSKSGWRTDLHQQSRGQQSRMKIYIFSSNCVLVLMWLQASGTGGPTSALHCDLAGGGMAALAETKSSVWFDFVFLEGTFSSVIFTVLLTVVKRSGSARKCWRPNMTECNSLSVSQWSAV